MRGFNWDTKYKVQDGKKSFFCDQTSSITYSADGDDLHVLFLNETPSTLFIVPVKYILKVFKYMYKIQTYFEEMYSKYYPKYIFANVTEIQGTRYRNEKYFVL